MAESAGTIGSGTRVRGRIKGTGALQVEGEVSGRIETDDAVTIAQNGRVEAEIHARSFTVLGNQAGSVHAERVEVRAGATVDGEIVAEILVVEPGSTMKGRLRMQLDLPKDLAAKGVG